jgi:polyisoprenyl-teichoic acid--peptidoglycan teichoic acid transferase
MVSRKPDQLIKARTIRLPSVGQSVWMGAGLLIGILSFLFLSGFVTCWRLTALPGIALASCKGNLVVVPTNAAGTPVAGVTATPTISAPAAELPPPWDGASRVTILVIGLDYRDWETGQTAPRSDTMILLTIDPVTKTAGMLSIPRDMWVNIPGFGYFKINNAYAYGELYHLPGGGSELAKETVENFLGISIQYTALVEFQTFENMIDTIDGIDVTVTKQLTVDPLGPHNTVTLEPGLDHMTGPVALAYARARDVSQGITGGDVERAADQQQVILAIRDKVLAPGNFLKLMSEAPTLYAELSGGVNTNLSLDDIRRLAMLAKDIPLDSIQRGVIDYTMMQDGTVNVNGQILDILRPYPDKIRELVDKIFGSGTMQPMASGNLIQNMQAEAARVVVINGTGVTGMAQMTADYLKSQGMNVIDKGNPSDYPDKYYSPFPDRTILIVHAGKPYAIQYLMALMKFDRSSQIIVDFDPQAPEDIVVALGHDWGGPPQ